MAGAPASAQVCLAAGCDFCLDCNSDGEVTLGEVQSVYWIFLGNATTDTCAIVDGLETSSTLGDAQQAYDQFLHGCDEESERIEQSVMRFIVVGFGPLHAGRGAAPPASGGPSLLVPAEATVPAGATVGPVLLSAEESFTTLLLSIPGTDGFYRADLPEPVTEVNVAITFGDDPPRSSFDCLFSAGDAGGAIGSPEVTAITIQ